MSLDTLWSGDDWQAPLDSQQRSQPRSQPPRPSPTWRAGEAGAPALPPSRFRPVPLTEPDGELNWDAFGRRFLP